MGPPTRTQGEWYSFGSSFFPAGEGSCLVLETTSLDHGDTHTGFVCGSATGKVKSALTGSMVLVSFGHALAAGMNNLTAL